MRVRRPLFGLFLYSNFIKMKGKNKLSKNNLVDRIGYFNLHPASNQLEMSKKQTCRIEV